MAFAVRSNSISVAFTPVKQDTPSFRDEGALRGTTLVADRPLCQQRPTGHSLRDNGRKPPPATSCCIGLHRQCSQASSVYWRSPLTPSSGSHLALPTRCGDDLLLLFIACSKGGMVMPPYIENLVDPEGFEPSTFSMPLRRAPKLRYGPLKWTWRDSNPRPLQCD